MIKEIEELHLFASIFSAVRESSSSHSDSREFIFIFSFDDLWSLNKPGKETNMKRDMERVPEKYMDIISGDFAYDPVRLPVDQDSTDTLYNRKTLESISETAHDARNPYTRQWFDIKCVIPQTELRKEMEDYINLRNFPVDTHDWRGREEIDVIADYTQILEEGEMKQLLEVMRTSVISQGYTGDDCFWEKIWKKINLIRLYCQSHVQNIETFRNLNGFIYFKEIIGMMYVHFRVYFNPDVTKEVTSMDICKEIVRIFDMIGLTSSDLVGIGSDVINKLIRLLWFVYIYKRHCLKTVTSVLRLYSKIFDELATDTISVIGRLDYLQALERDLGPVTSAQDKFTFTRATVAKNILSEDLNHGITILLRAFLSEAKLNNIDEFARSIVDAVTLCISREIETPDQRGFSEGQMREAQAQRWHNSEALAKGLQLINAVISRGGALADILQEKRIVKHIVDMLKLHLTFVCEKGCNSACCVHIRIAVRVLEILHTLLQRGRPLFGIDHPVRLFSRIIERATSNNPDYRFEDLMEHLPRPYVDFYTIKFGPPAPPCPPSKFYN